MPQLSLSELRQTLLNNLGLNFTERSEDELYKKIGDAAKEFQFDNTDKFIDWINKTHFAPTELEKLASFLTIGETYFLREIKALNYLEKVYLPELIKKRINRKQSIRIWCAGCASGEEPFSIAMLLKRIIPDLKNWNISILASDINAKFLEKARKGIYTKWSFRKLPETFKKQYFNEIEKDTFQIKQEIHSMVTFVYQNLATDTYPSLVNNTNAMDIILCRNVLIYFSNIGIRQVSSKLYNSLTKGGVLLVSPVEMSSLICQKFRKIFYEGFTIYAKGPEALKIKDSATWKIPETIFIEEKFKPVNPKELVNVTNKPTEVLKEKSLPESVSVKKSTIEEMPLYEDAKKMYASGKFEELEIFLTNILNEKGEISNSQLKLLIKTEANLGKLDIANDLCKKAIEINKLDANLYFIHANIQQELGEDAKAIKTLKKVIYIEPEFSMAHFALGNLSRKYGKDMESRKHFRNTLSMLSKFNTEHILEDCDGLTVGRLVEIINTIIEL
ncbi:MAG: hypothetical protein JEZ09_11120 [Salinivirgaceae bacterium]|nr:hypothetical protein [Salinivirgaceae bacterium]